MREHELAIVVAGNEPDVLPRYEGDGMLGAQLPVDWKRVDQRLLCQQRLDRRGAVTKRAARGRDD